MDFGKLLWRVHPRYKQCRKSIFRIDPKNKDGCLVTLNHAWGEKEREMHTEMEVLPLSFRETKREITVIKIDEKKEETGKRLVNDCHFQGHLPSAGRWDEGNPPQPRHGFVERRCVCLCNSWEIWELTTDHRLEDSSVLCSQGSTHWKRIRGIFLSEVVCGLENCEPLGEEQLKQGLRYLCMEASCSELSPEEVMTEGSVSAR